MRIHPRLTAAGALAALATATLVAGCGGGHQDGRTRLVVRQVPLASPRFIEGSVTFLRLERAGVEEPVFEGRVTDRPHGGNRGVIRLLAQTLPSGPYRLISYQRSCSPSCEFGLGPPTDHCEVALGLTGGAPATATVVLDQGGGCSILVTPAPPAPAHLLSQCAGWRLDQARLVARVVALWRASAKSAQAEQGRIHRAAVHYARIVQGRARVIGAYCQ
jgi:hypothetical protein